MNSDVSKPKQLNADYCIQVNFDKGTESPARVFKTMSGLIDTFQELDRHLVSSIDVRIEPVLLLEDIETGSIKTWISTALKMLPDDAIYNFEWKKLVGYYLLKAKYRIINFLEGTTTITNVNQIKPLQNELNILAQETGVRMIPDYKQIDTRLLLEDMSNISSSLSHLVAGDKAVYITKEEKAFLNMEFKLAPDSIEELYVQEVLVQEITQIMKVKKADFLGDSMWEFRFGEKNIPVKISDKEWLDKFQSNKVNIQPGDAIKGIVQISDKYDTERNLISHSYELLQVIDVIKMQNSNQIEML
jgi:hypothetical protein